MGRKNRGTTHISDSKRDCEDQFSNPPALRATSLRKGRLSLGHSSTVNGVSRQSLFVSEQWLVVSDQRNNAEVVRLYSKGCGKSTLITDH